MGAIGHVVSGVFSLLIVVGVAAMLADGRSLVRAENNIGDRLYLATTQGDPYYGIGMLKDSHGRLWVNENHFVNARDCETHKKLGQTSGGFSVMTIVFAVLTVLCNLLGRNTGKGLFGLAAMGLSAGMMLCTLIGFSTAGAFYDKSYECDNIAPGCPFVTPTVTACGAYTCPNGFTRKTGVNSTQACTNNVCTTALCCDDLRCNTFTCPAGTNDKANKATLPCLASGCADATCCDAKVCTAHTCSTNFVKKANDGTINCLAAACADVTCCDPQCGSHTCAAGFGKKAAVTATTACGADCAATCCELTTCAGFTCAANTALAAAPPACGGAGTACSQAHCCTVKLCGGYTCTAGTAAPPAWTATRCAADPCTNAECCSATKCNSVVTCPFSQVLNTLLTCAPAGCAAAQCCETRFSCGTYTCASAALGLRPLPTATPCPLAGCTDALCCVAKMCDTHTCSSGRLITTSPLPAVRACLNTGCTDATCCESSGSATTCANYACGSPGAVLKANAASVTCGVSGILNLCNDLVCCTAQCQQDFKMKDTYILGYALPILVVAFFLSIVNIVAVAATGGTADEKSGPEEDVPMDTDV